MVCATRFHHNNGHNGDNYYALLGRGGWGQSSDNWLAMCRTTGVGWTLVKTPPITQSNIESGVGHKHGWQVDGQLFSCPVILESKIVISALE